MIVQFFSNSMIFPRTELLLVIFQVLHDFQSLWEPSDPSIYSIQNVCEHGGSGMITQMCMLILVFTGHLDVISTKME